MVRFLTLYMETTLGRPGRRGGQKARASCGELAAARLDRSCHAWCCLLDGVRQACVGKNATGTEHGRREGADGTAEAVRVGRRRGHRGLCRVGGCGGYGEAD